MLQYFLEVKGPVQFTALANSAVLLCLGKEMNVLVKTKVGGGNPHSLLSFMPKIQSPIAFFFLSSLRKRVKKTSSCNEGVKITEGKEG